MFVIRFVFSPRVAVIKEQSMLDVQLGEEEENSFHWNCSRHDFKKEM